MKDNNEDNKNILSVLNRATSILNMHGWWSHDPSNQIWLGAFDNFRLWTWAAAALTWAEGEQPWARPEHARGAWFWALGPKFGNRLKMPNIASNQNFGQDCCGLSHPLKPIADVFTLTPTTKWRTPPCGERDAKNANSSTTNNCICCSYLLPAYLSSWART